MLIIFVAFLSKMRQSWENRRQTKKKIGDFLKTSKWWKRKKKRHSPPSWTFFLAFNPNGYSPPWVCLSKQLRLRSAFSCTLLRMAFLASAFRGPAAPKLDCTDPGTQHSLGVLLIQDSGNGLWLAELLAYTDPCLWFCIHKACHWLKYGHQELSLFT